MNIILRPWLRYADFRGRARRTEYCLFWVMLWALTFGALFLAGIAAAVATESRTGEDAENAAALIIFVPVGLLWLAALVPSIAVTVRRMHDIDLSGWMALLTWLPGVGWIVLLVFGFIPGTAGANRYGPDPRGGVRRMEEVFG